MNLCIVFFFLISYLIQQCWLNLHLQFIDFIFSLKRCLGTCCFWYKLMKYEYLCIIDTGKILWRFMPVLKTKCFWIYKLLQIALKTTCSWRCYQTEAIIKIKLQTYLAEILVDVKYFIAFLVTVFRMTSSSNLTLLKSTKHNNLFHWTKRDE